MGAFEDNIRNKFNSAEVPMGSGSWDAFEHKLDGAQMSDLLFTQKVVNALEFSLVPYSPQHWKAMHRKLDLDVEGNFESKIRSKFAEANLVAGPAVGWENMLSKLDAADAGEFEKSVKEKINKEEVEYDEEHWKQMEKMLDKDKKPALWAFVVTGILVLGAVATWGLSRNDAGKFAENKNKNEIEHVVSKGDAVSQQKIEQTVVAPVADSEEEDVTNFKDIGVYEPTTEVERKYLSKYKRTSNLTESEFITGQRRLVQENKRKYASSKNNIAKSKIGRMVGGNVGGISGTGNVNTTAVSTCEKSQSSEEELFKMDEMIEENVAFREPYLDYQFTEVKYDKVKVKEAVLHAGLLPWLNFWDNAAATGLSGKHQVSLFSAQNFKIYRRYGKQVGFEFNQPLQVLGGYEYNSEKSGFSVGTYLGNTWQANWVCSTVNVSTSYEKNLGNSVLRFGAGLNYKRNQLFTEGLTLRDQVSQTANNFNETSLDQLKVPAETYLMTSAGVMLANEHFLFAYNISNPLIFRINYNNEKKINHSGIASGTVSLNNAVKMSAMAKVTRDEAVYFTPAISMAKDNSWFLLTEYEELSRFIYTLGYQFSSFRTYASYGHVTKRDVESSITDLFSQSGHVAVGITYTRQ